MTFLARKFIVEQFPIDVREKIDFFIGEGFNPLSIFRWLEENVYPKWRKDGKGEFCVTRRTIYNYVKNRCPENLLVSDSYLKEARKRVDDDINSIGEIRSSINVLDKLIKSFNLDNPTLKEKGELRRLIKEKIESEKKFMELQIRLGLVKDVKKVDTTDDILERLRKEQKIREEKTLEKVVEP